MTTAIANPISTKTPQAIALINNEGDAVFHVAEQKLSTIFIQALLQGNEVALFGLRDFNCSPAVNTLTSYADDKEYDLHSDEYSIKDLGKVIDKTKGLVFACEITDNSKYTPSELLIELSPEQMAEIRRHALIFVESMSITSATDVDRYRQTYLQHKAGGIMPACIEMPFGLQPNVVNHTKQEKDVFANCVFTAKFSLMNRKIDYKSNQFSRLVELTLTTIHDREGIECLMGLQFTFDEIFQIAYGV